MLHERGAWSAEFPHTCGVDPLLAGEGITVVNEFPHTCGVDPSSIESKKSVTS